MTSKDIDRLVRWSIDTDLMTFAEEAYGVTGTAFDVASEGDYLRGKFKQMQSNFIMWIAGLSENNRKRLADNITKEKLPFLNQEIAKILATIVDFEIFFENDDSKLNILIKHPGFEPRPISMGSGAEKTIAAMAIRLALINVTNLPKPNMFILDEPGTALDEENMEGFIRLLNISKSYFKTVLIISHLDSLKDIADMTIDIQRKGSYAFISQ